MAIPDFQSLMLPMLKIAGDKKEHTLSEVMEKLAQEFNLTEEDRKELLPSGMQARFDNRVGWTRTYLTKACLLEKVERGSFRITERGSQVLKENHEFINVKYLKKFAEIREFIGIDSQIGPGNGDGSPDQTPEEILATNYQKLRESLASDLLEQIKSLSPKFFENLVVDLLVGLGYGGSRRDAAQAVGRSKDGGIDGIIKEDSLGLDVIYIQAKRWEGTVGKPAVHSFAGSLDGVHSKKGVFLTTSTFSQDARNFVKAIDKKIILIDGQELVDLMIDHNLGVTESQKYILKKIDLDYFTEE
jgi:restriction system protein